jgi:tetratricopeptide (TPR) repeat protein
MKGDFKEAARLYRKALAIDPHFYDAQLDLGKVLVDLDETEEAIAVARKLIEGRPGDAHGYRLLGAASLARHALQEAKQAYEAAIKLDPEDYASYVGLATACAGLGQREQATQYRRKSEQVYGRARKGARSLRDAYDVATLRQRLVDAYANTGRLYRGQKDLREAELSFERAAALDPKHVESRQALVSLYRKSGRTADAIRVLEQLTEIAPSLVDYPLEVGCLYLELGQTEQAEAALRKACARDAKSAASRVALVGLYLKTKRKPADAVALARQAAELQPTANNYWLLAAACRHNGDRAAALAAMEKAVDLDPGNLRYREAYESLKEKK